MKGPTTLDPVPLNPNKAPPAPERINFLSPNVPSAARTELKTPDKKATPSPKGSPSPSPSPSTGQKQNSPSVYDSNGRDKSRSNASMVDPSVPVACANCKIPYLPKLMLTTNCKNKHKMCRYCTMKFRGKDCEVCKLVEQEHLDKYFCYK